MDQKLCECGCGQPTPLYKCNALKRGIIKGQSSRFLRGHQQTKRFRLLTNEKRCPHCDQIKSLEDFVPRKDSLSGRTSWCRLCRNQHEKEKFAKNPLLRTVIKERFYNNKTSEEIDEYIHRQNENERIKYQSELQTEEGVKKHRLKRLLVRYKITLEDFNDYLKLQGNRCAICADPFNFNIKSESPHVDHDHVTGKVRGLLCYKCNFGLGFFKDDVFRLRSAEQYLAKNIG